MKWTKAQEAAIKTNGDDLLVAAGAGSGKTAVLVARILRKILGEGTAPCNVDRLLIVTFTKAAAQEMRQRLFEALDERLLDEQITEEVAKRVYLQQTLLANATITTIHGFCTKVVMGNNKESGIDGSFRVGDEAETEVLLQESAEEICEYYSVQHPTGYEALVDTYGTYRSDDEFVDYVKRLALFALAFPEPKAWIRNHAAQFRQMEGHDLTETVWGKTLLRNLRLEIEAQCEAVEQLYRIVYRHQVTPYVETLELDRAEILRGRERLTQSGITWEAAKQAMEGIQMGGLNALRGNAKKNLSPEALEAIEGFSDRRNDIKGRIREIKNQYFSSDIPDAYEQAVLLREDVELLGEMACGLLDVFTRKKRENHIIDYSDLEHLAYQVLKEDRDDGALCPSDVALRYQTQFNEIFIDEYQDTNLIQEAILSLVSGKWNGKPNLFMVGDIKQSVYGFRQACPDLFLDKYVTYRDVRDGASQGAGARVCLYQNFRSRQAVLDTVNRVFQGVMRENTCGMNYTPEEYLNYGARYYDEVELPQSGRLPDPCTEIVLVNNKGFESKKLPEMHEVARRIETLIETQYPVYDKSTESLRPIRYGDICILFRSAARNGRIYRDYLLSRNIPAICPEKGGFFKRPEVQVLFSFLKVLDNPRQDIPLIAVLRNIYGVTDAQLSQILLDAPGRELCFWERVKVQETAKGGLIARCVARIEALRLEIRNCTIGEIVWKCMHENDFFDRLLTLPAGAVARQNLLLLMNRAVQYDTTTNKGLYTFVNRLEALEKGSREVPGAGAVEDGLNAVRIMTIHGSKGLEFPVVFLCDTGSGRDKRDEGKKLLLHRDLGFGPTCYDRDARFIFPSIMRMAVRQQMALDTKAEELRVLYVALTRAREKLIVTGTTSKDMASYVEDQRRCCDFENGIPMDYYVLHTENYLALLVMSLCNGFSPSYKIQPALYTEELDASYQVDKDTLNFAYELPPMKSYAGPKEEHEIEKKFAPAKVSVSQLGKLEAEPFYPQAPVQKLADADDTQGGAQVGTLIHSVLQQVDYSRLSQDTAEMEAYARELLQTMAERGFMTEAERKLVPVEILISYFTSEFARNLGRAEWRMQEVPFTFLRPWKDLTGEDLPGETAVQGVMDLVAQVSGELILVDFKSDRVYGDYTAHSERYQTQISVYREACVRAFGKAPAAVYLYYLRGGHPERITL